WLCILPSKCGRQVAEGVRLLLQVLRLLLGDADGIRAADEAARRLLLVGDGEQGPARVWRGRLPAGRSCPHTTAPAPHDARRSPGWTASRSSSTPASADRCGR